MNDTFLQQNPLKMFDDFVEIPDEVFSNKEDVAEICALVDTICENEDFGRVLKTIYEKSPETIAESKRKLESYVKKASETDSPKNTYIKKFFSRAINDIDEIIKYGRSFKKDTVKIYRCDPRAILPKYKDPGDAGADIYTIEDTRIPPHSTTLIKTGLKGIVPGGYKREVVPRSGLSLTTNLRIANTPGTIDSGYRGEVGIIAENTGDEELHFSQFARIAQFILVPIIKINWEEINEEKFESYNTERGLGFGSSGLKDE